LAYFLLRHEQSNQTLRVARNAKGEVMISFIKNTRTFTRLILSAATVPLMAPLAFAGGSALPGYTPDLLPANPTAGLCYARVEIPAQYETSSESVLVEEAYSTIEVEQPQLATREEKIMIKEASVRYRVRQPSYRSVSEKVMTRPAYDKLSVSAPQFSSVTETMKVSAPRLVWKKGNPGQLARQGYKIHSTADAGRGGQGYASTVQYGQTGGATHCGPTCEIWCLVEEPGESVSYNKKVMTSAGQVRRTRVPAKYQTVLKQVVSDPGGVEEIPVPAEYRTLLVEDLISAGGERTVNVPAKYGEVAKKVLVTPERYEWRQVVCKPGTGSIRSSQSYSRHKNTVVTPTPTYTAPRYSAPAATSTYTAPAAAKHHTSKDCALHDNYESYMACRKSRDSVTHYQNSGTSYNSSSSYGSGTTQSNHSQGTSKSHQSITYGGKTSSYGSGYTSETPSGNAYEGAPARKRMQWRKRN